VPLRGIDVAHMRAELSGEVQGLFLVSDVAVGNVLDRRFVVFARQVILLDLLETLPQREHRQALVLGVVLRLLIFGNGLVVLPNCCRRMANWYLNARLSGNRSTRLLQKSMSLWDSSCLISAQRRRSSSLPVFSACFSASESLCRKFRIWASSHRSRTSAFPSESL